MNNFEARLHERMQEIRQQGLFRQLRCVDSPQSTRIEMDGRPMLNFSSNDYLGLASHSALAEAAIKAVESFGTGSGASRLICGSLAPHHELETNLAQFKHCEAALSFSSGYAAAIGTICALIGRDDVIVLDKLVHACIVDAAKLSGAKIRVFAHNDLDSLEAILRWAEQRPASPGNPEKSNVLIVTESLFSMDGDFAPLPDIVKLKEKYGAWLMVDEAHATGLFGQNRRGLAEHAGVSDRIEIQMGTLGKALGSAGGYICGSHTLVEFLINRARSFIFSTAPVPAAAAAASAGISVVKSEEGRNRVDQLREIVNESRRLLPSHGWQLEKTPSAIIPLRLGEETRAVKVAEQLRDDGIFIPAIRFPTVKRGEARLRLTLTANHTSQDLNQLVTALSRVLPQPTAAGHA